MKNQFHNYTIMMSCGHNQDLSQLELVAPRVNDTLHCFECGHDRLVIVVTDHGVVDISIEEGDNG